MHVLTKAPHGSRVYYSRATRARHSVGAVGDDHERGLVRPRVSRQHDRRRISVVWVGASPHAENSMLVEWNRGYMMGHVQRVDILWCFMIKEFGILERTSAQCPPAQGHEAVLYNNIHAITIGISH